MMVKPLSEPELETWLKRSRGRQIDGFDTRLAATIDALTEDRDRLQAMTDRQFNVLTGKDRELEAYKSAHKWDLQRVDEVEAAARYMTMAFPDYQSVADDPRGHGTATRNLFATLPALPEREDR